MARFNSTLLSSDKKITYQWGNGQKVTGTLCSNLLLNFLSIKAKTVIARLLEMNYLAGLKVRAVKAASIFLSYFTPDMMTIDSQMNPFPI